MMRSGGRFLLGRWPWLMIGMVGCAGGLSQSPAEIEQSVAAAAGALIKVEMKSTVGVLLDELPAGSLRDAAAADALGQADAFWIARAESQTKLASYRLVFRGGFYADPKGPLPLPNHAVWNLRLDGKPRRQRVSGHDLVATDYTFSTYLVSPTGSPADTEPALAKVGGTWDEPFVLPADPELLLQRTGFACMDENEFPPGSVFEENVHYYYDQTCDVETPDAPSCHITSFPAESCQDALTHHVGAVASKMRFSRVKYDRTIANSYRVGAVVNPAGADLAVFREDMVDEHRVYYRYFTPDSCEIVEGAIGSPGWRRLLTFSASVRNDGTNPIHLGDVTDPANPYQQQHDFEFSSCHNHYHFSHYGNFNYNGTPGSKRAFCLEDTNRYHNDEVTPLTAIHQSCTYQGIGAGWGDEYNFGLPGQWVDITDVDATRPHDLTFDSNVDQFLCEGQTLGVNHQPVDPLDLANLAFDPTAFTDGMGNVEGRVRCEFPPNWAADNHGAVSFSSPGGSFVTDGCTRGQIGPLRDCGFGLDAKLASCTPGATVKLRCEADGPGAGLLRICERSEKIGAIACTYRDSAANAMILNEAQVKFPCPTVRDAAHPGTGGYTIYQAPLQPWQAAPGIHCEVQ